MNTVTYKTLMAIIDNSSVKIKDGQEHYTFNEVQLAEIIKSVNTVTNQRVIKELDMVVTDVNSVIFNNEFEAIQKVADYVRNRQEQLKENQ
jgi:hypothetical protein